MNSEMGFSLRTPASDGACLRDDPRGARHWGASSRHKLHMRVGPSRSPLSMERGNLAGSRIASSADVPETSSVASPIVLSMLHWSSGRAAAPFPFH